MVHVCLWCGGGGEEPRVFSLQGGDEMVWPAAPGGCCAEESVTAAPGHVSSSPAAAGRSSSTSLGVSESSPGQGPSQEPFQSPNPASEEHELNTTRRNVALRNVLLHR